MYKKTKKTKRDKTWANTPICNLELHIIFYLFATFLPVCELYIKLQILKKLYLLATYKINDLKGYKDKTPFVDQKSYKVTQKNKKKTKNENRRIGNTTSKTRGSANFLPPQEVTFNGKIPKTREELRLWMPNIRYDLIFDTSVNKLACIRIDSVANSPSKGCPTSSRTAVVSPS